MWMTPMVGKVRDDPGYVLLSLAIFFNCQIFSILTGQCVRDPFQVLF